MKCPECGMVMVKRLAKAPFQSVPYMGVGETEPLWYWWCGCGKEVERYIERRHDAGWGKDECREMLERANMAPLPKGVAIPPIVPCPAIQGTVEEGLFCLPFARTCDRIRQWVRRRTGRA